MVWLAPSRLISNFIPAAFAAFPILLMISARFGILSVYCQLDKAVNSGLDKPCPYRIDSNLHASAKRAHSASVGRTAPMSIDTTSDVASTQPSVSRGSDTLLPRRSDRP